MMGKCIERVFEMVWLEDNMSDLHKPNSPLHA